MIIMTKTNKTKINYYGVNSTHGTHHGGYVIATSYMDGYAIDMQQYDRICNHLRWMGHGTYIRWDIDAPVYLDGDKIKKIDLIGR